MASVPWLRKLGPVETFFLLYTKSGCLKSWFYEMIELNLIMTRQFLFSEKSRTNLTLEIKWEGVHKRGRKSTVQTYSYVISCVEF